MNAYDFTQSAQDYRRIEEAIGYIEANATHQPELAEIAANLHLSEYHFQRLFTRWAGISPKRFLQFLTKENAKHLLAESGDLLDATYQAGLSSPGRLHDLFIQTEAVTPGEYKSRGRGVQIVYGFHPTPFGECLLALTDKGICWLAFVDEGRTAALQKLKAEWANAIFLDDPVRTQVVVEKIFERRSSSPKTTSDSDKLVLHLRGTNFQIKVWEALLRIPPGKLTSYEALAGQVCTPRAAQAVGNAVGRNPVAYLIPCHRVLKKAGGFGNYRYGPRRKKAILAWELVEKQLG